MRRKPGLLAELDAKTTGEWLRSLDGHTSKRDLDKALDRFHNPGRREILLMVDDELAELASRQPRTKLGELALSELRRRGAWRTPDRWTMIISALALVVSIVAIVMAARAG